MVLWGAVFGAILGWTAARFETVGAIAGGVFGALAAIWLRKLIHAEIERTADEHDADIRAWIERRLAVSTALRPAEMVYRTDPAPVPEEDVRPVEVEAESDTPDRVASAWGSPEQQGEPYAIGATRVSSTIESERTPGVFDAARQWLADNVIVSAGLVVLFIGLSFLARYAANAGLFPVELRLALVAVAGIALLVVGFTRREARPTFALALQGTGIATIYLTVFAAARMFDVVALLPAFSLMVVVSALSCVLALKQNSQTLAIAAFAGGFAVPVLLSTGSGSVAVLFGYYTILNLAVLAIAQMRAWRLVNLVGFVATFGVATAWGVLHYDPANYAVAQTFLVIFIAIYLAVAILYARNTPGRLGNVVDSALLFGPALIGFGLQIGLVRDVHLGSAFSALAFGAVYLAIAAALQRAARDSYRLLFECMIAIGAGFVTLAVPLALGARWTSSVWALEGVGAFWVGMRQARWMPRLFGIFLQLAAVVAFVTGYIGNVAAYPLIDPAFVGVAIIAVSVLTIAWWVRRPLPHSGSSIANAYAVFESQLSPPAFIAGVVLWLMAIAFEVTRHLPPVEVGVASVPAFSSGMQWLLALLAIMASAWVSAFVGRRTGWRVATWPSYLTLAPIALTLFSQIVDGRHILYWPDVLIWLAVIGLHAHMLYLNDRDAAEDGPQQLAGITHMAGVWVVLVMLADCLWLGIDRAGLWQTSWASVIMLVSATAALLALAIWAARVPARGWPLARYATEYAWSAALPVAALVYLGALAASLFDPGQTEPLPYVPLLNPVDLSLALGIGALLFWRRAVIAAAIVPAGAEWFGGRAFTLAVGGLGFIALNTVWLRTAHHFLGVAWTPSAMRDSFIVQSGVSIVWTLLAVALMLVAHRRSQRPMWLTGAGLLALVVIKLLLVDLSNAGGGPRIVSFIAVGALMLIVGYFAPLPPRRDDDAAAEVVSS